MTLWTLTEDVVPRGHLLVVVVPLPGGVGHLLSHYLQGLMDPPPSQCPRCWQLTCEEWVQRGTWGALSQYWAGVMLYKTSFNVTNWMKFSILLPHFSHLKHLRRLFYTINSLNFYQIVGLTLNENFIHFFSLYTDLTGSVWWTSHQTGPTWQDTGHQAVHTGSTSPHSRPE